MKKLLLGLCLFPALAFAQAVLPTAWNFSNPTIDNPPTGWSYDLGTGNKTYASGIGDAISIRFDQTGEYLQIFFADKPGTLSFYARGQYANNPGFTGVFNIQESVDGTSWANIRTFNDGSLGTNLVRFENTLNAASRYVRFYYTEKKSGSNAQFDSVLILPAPPPPLAITVKQSATTLVNGNTFVTGNAAATTFTLQNTGTSDVLNIDSITLSGAAAADFSAGAPGTNAINAGQNTTFQLNFTAGAPGSRFATMNIYSNDAEKNPFVVNLYGIGGNFASEPTGQPGAVNFSSVKAFAFNVGFGAASPVAEKYIVLRKTGSTLTEEPVDGQTYQRGDVIGGAQVAYIGTDPSVVLKPNYILANTDYTFAVFSVNGPEGYENYYTAAPAKGTTTSLAGNPGTYYNGIASTNSNFISQLTAKINPHDTVFYSNYAPTIVNNFLARDTTGGRKVVNCVYTGIPYIYNEPFVWWSGSNSGILTREHTFAQSWMPSNQGGSWPEVNGKEVPEYNDLHHLFPAHQTEANGLRSNLPFGVVVNVTNVSSSGFGKKGTSSTGQTVYEPIDSQKGDLARALFYMCVTYNGARGIAWKLPSQQDLAVLRQWNTQDPPDAYEIARHEYIVSQQHNRNPFIDHPEWADRINFSNMTYIPDPSAELVTVTAPNGGEFLGIGQNSNITWTSQNVDTVVIEYKNAAGAQWILITDTVPGSRGSYTWNVPNNPTATAMVKISEKNNTTVTDSSNAVFTIELPRSIVLNNPNGGETLQRGKDHVITWTSSNIDSVKIEIQSVPNAAYTAIANASGAAGQYTWTVNSPVSAAARIRVSDKTRSTVNDVSNAVFEVVQSSLNITDPTITSDVKAASAYTVKWTSSHVAMVDVWFQYDGGAKTAIATGINNVDSFVWTVPDTISENVVLGVDESGTAAAYAAKDTTKFNITRTTGLFERTLNANDFIVYPNPSNGTVYINGIHQNIRAIDVMDITGKLVDRAESTNSVSIQHKGLYLLKITTSEGSAYKKVMIQ